MIEKMEKKTLLRYVSIALVAFYPLLELDYLLADSPLPRVSTLIYLGIFPLIVLASFYLFEKNKKVVILGALLWGVPFVIYFFLHGKQADYLQYQMYLPKNFIFLWKDEILYTYILLLPMVMVYVFWRQQPKEEYFKKAIVVLSSSVSLPIFFANLLVVGKSTYHGNTIASFLSWFSLPFDGRLHHPRFYAGKFFFEEGNTIGVILLMTLPLLYYFWYKSEKRVEKWMLGLLIVIQSLSMIILSTRVAAYGSVLVPVALLLVWILLIALRKEKFRVFFLVFLLLVGGASASVLPFSPAYQNQLLDAQDYQFIKRDDNERSSAKETLRREAEGLVPYSKEWLDFYTFMFEEYVFLMNVTPPVYYQEWYDYHHDPKFWVDLIFDYELEERVSGRQIENIFTRYKYEPLSQKEKWLGMGYSTFMRGSILIEQDFKQQYYSFGAIGFLFVQLPWLLLLVYAGILFLTGYHKGRWNFLNIVLLMSVAMTFLAAYVSGHVLDELSSSLCLSLIFAMYFVRVHHES